MFHALLVGAAAAAAADPRGMQLALAKCNGDASQQFTFAVVAPYLNPAAVMSTLGVCLDLPDWRTVAKRDRPPANLARPGAGAPVNGWHCGENAWTNQYWAVRGDTLATLHPDAAGLCFGIGEGASAGGAGGALAECSSDAAQFRFGFHGAGNSTLVHAKSGMCVTVTGPVLPPPPPPPLPPPPSPPNTPCPPLPAPGPPGPVPQGDRPCDIYASAGTPCVAAHSMVRALFGKFDGALYLVERASDHANTTISVDAAGGYANAAAHHRFCADTDCEVITIYDQSDKGNHLLSRHPGRHFSVDYGVNASAQPVLVGGHLAYGARFDEGMGYRNDHTVGLAVGEEPESMYAVMGGDHYNDMCCFDYGNAESHFGADGAGTMEAIYYGNCTSWWAKEDRAHIPKSWHGPILMADLEAGMYGGNDTFSPQNSPIDFEFNTLILKGRKCEMSLKGGNAQAGNLTTKYDGGRPTHADYNPMRKQGGLVLGTGGDNSDRALGIFYEGAITTGYASVACDDAIQANIVAAGYTGAGG